MIDARALVDSLLTILCKPHDNGPWAPAGAGMDMLKTQLKCELSLEQQGAILSALVSTIELYPQTVWRPKGEGHLYLALGELARWQQLSEVADVQKNSDLVIYGGQRFEERSDRHKPLHEEWSYLGDEGRWWVPHVEIALHAEGVEVRFWRSSGEAFACDLMAASINRYPASTGELPASIHHESTPDRQQWQLDLDSIEQHWDMGLDKVVWARTHSITLEEKVSAKDLLFHALELDPSHFSIWHALDHGRCFISHTPEKLYHRHGQYLEVDSIAGTRPRGSDEMEDFALASELFQSAKERREQQIVTDFVVAQLGTLCERIEVPEVPRILQLSHVQHLHSPIRARMRDNNSDADILKLLHPTPALGGQPRGMAMELLATNSSFNRGNYGAPFGRFSREESLVAVAIRCLLHLDNRVHCFAGCGIVAGSDAQCEWQETSHKMRPFLNIFMPGASSYIPDDVRHEPSIASEVQQ